MSTDDKDMETKPNSDAASERAKRQRVEVRLKWLEEKVASLQAELERRSQEVRYLVGDAVVRAARPSLDTLLLPWRLLTLYFQGRQQQKTRVRAGLDDKRARHPRFAGPTRIKPGEERALRSFLFFCVNGAGLGHLTRSLAVARRIRRLDPKAPIYVLTSSRALSAISSEGLVPYHIPSHDACGGSLDAAAWNELLQRQLRLIVDTHGPANLVYDGVSPYGGLIRAIESCRFNHCAMILRLRHKHGWLSEEVGRLSAFDELIFPGEAGAQDTGELIPPELAGTEHCIVPPLLYYDRDELLAREEARREWGIPPDRKAVYVQLGAGNINDTETWIDCTLALLSKRKDVEVVLATSPIAQRTGGQRSGVRQIQRYPNSLYFNAIDLAISASGYNTFHELMHFGVPSILIPNQETETDDQVARAQAAQRAGAAVAVLSPDALPQAIEHALTDEVAGRMRQSALKLAPENGAMAVAERLLRAARRASASNTRPASVALSAAVNDRSNRTVQEDPATAASPTGRQTPQPAGKRNTPLVFQPVCAPQRPPRSDVKAAVVMDEFSLECFRPELHLMEVMPEDWERVLSAERPDFLFIESAWKGSHGAWQVELAHARQLRDNALFALVEWCKSHSVPTVFWNKEDPSNFEVFIDLARRFDHIFTTDANCIERYRQRVGHDRIHALPFAAQPAIHNPIGSSAPRFGNFCFAGTYYAGRHADRRGEIDLLLGLALRRGLTIFDRMHGDVPSDDYRFPPEYQSVVYGALPYAEMVDAYKRFSVFLNVNSVKDSPTMFSRRVFELLACGTPVISTYALGIDKLLGGDCVALVDSVEDAERWMDALIENPEVGEQMVLRGQRRVFSEHTYERRLRTILETLCLAVAATPRRVSVVSVTRRPALLDDVIANYRRQAYPDKELIVILNSDSFSMAEVQRKLAAIPNARVFQRPQACTLGQCLNYAIDRAEFEYVAKLDDDGFYGEHYLTDAINAFLYCGAEIAGKRSHYAYLRSRRCLALRFPECEHQQVQSVPGATMVMRRGLFEELRFPEDVEHDVDTRFQRACTDRGFGIYSIDRYNFVANRAESTPGQTSQIPDDEFLEGCRIVACLDDYREQISV